MVRKVLIVGALALAACGAPETDEAAAPEAAASVAAAEAPPYKAVHDIHWLMLNVVQPSAEGFWNSAGYVIDAEGEHSLRPTTEEGWADVVTHAAIVAELGNLLMTPPFADGRGEDWYAFAGGLVDIGMAAQAAAESRSEDEIFETGEILDRVCEACHVAYDEYPGPDSEAQPQ